MRRGVTRLLIIRLLAHGVVVEGAGWLDSDGYHRMVAVLDGESRNHIDGVAGRMQNMELRLDFEIAIEAKKVVEKPGVWTVDSDALVSASGKPGLVCRRERPDEILGQIGWWHP